MKLDDCFFVSTLGFLALHRITQSSQARVLFSFLIAATASQSISQ
jgi:hypothetical protein